MLYDMRLPGYGGAGVFLRRTTAGDPAGQPGVDIWLLGPTFCHAALRRQTEPHMLAELARYFYAVAADEAPQLTMPTFQDTTAGLSITVGSSDDTRIGLLVNVIDDVKADSVSYLDIDFETSRAALVRTAQGIADTIGGIDLVDFGKLH